MKKIFLLVVLGAMHVYSDNVYMKSGYVYKNVIVLDTLESQLRIRFDSSQVLIATDQIDRFVRLPLLPHSNSVLIWEPQTTSFSPTSHFPTSKQADTLDVQLTTVRGDTFWGAFIKSDDSTVTYLTKDGQLTLKKTEILSLTKKSIMARSDNQNTHKPKTTKIEIKEYKQLPLLIFVVAGGVWSYDLIKKSNDLSDAVIVYDKLIAIATGSLKQQLEQQKESAKQESDQKLLQGIAIGSLSFIIFVISVQPTIDIIEQPISVVPTNHGVSLCIRF